VTFCLEPVLAYTNKAFELLCREELSKPALDRLACDLPENISDLFYPGFPDHRHIPPDRNYSHTRDSNPGQEDEALLNCNYLDCSGGYGSYNPGQSSGRVKEFVQKQLNSHPLCNQVYSKLHATMLSKILNMITPADLNHIIITATGTEAVENGLNLARICTGRNTIISAAGSTHGSNLRLLNLNGKINHRQKGYSLNPNFHYVPYGDADILTKIMQCAHNEGNDVAAVILEPFQSETGAVIPGDDYLAQASELCNYYSTQLIIDETGIEMGRTGKIFAFEHFGITPDILCLGKALGGGILPLGALITSDKPWALQTNTPAYNQSSLTTAPFSCAAAITAMKVLFDEGLIERSDEKGNYILPLLKRIACKYPVIKEIRGKGLLLGLEFKKERYALALTENLLKNRIIITTALNNRSAIKIEPPLTVSIEQIDHLLEILEKEIKRISYHQ